MAVQKIKVLMVSSEAVPFAKVGGLADVVGALGKELPKTGVQVAVALPKYRVVIEKIKTLGLKTEKKMSFSLSLDNGEEEGAIELVKYNGVLYFLIEQPDYFEREGIYLDNQTKQDYPDNLKRFVFFNRAVLEAAKLMDFQPDIIHAHDWQTGLLPIYLKTLYKLDSFYRLTKSVFTIHNLSYQGIFPVEQFTQIGLDWKYFTINGLEYYGHLNLMKGGIVFSDYTSTVSETYAKEIQTPEFGNGLEGVIQEKAEAGRLAGIVNGVDYSEWDPSVDTYLKNEFGILYDSKSVEKKSEIKKAFLKKNKIPEKAAKWPLIGVISRLVDQKGWDIILEVIERFFQEDVILAVLGTGKYEYENRLRKLKDQYKNKMVLTIDFDIPQSHFIEAAADIYIVPSRFEPCGLNQLYSMRYGTIPVVRKTGGLADTVVDGKTGFVFDNYNPDALYDALTKALELYRNDKKKWAKLVQNAMKEDWSWKGVAKKYSALYTELKKQNDNK